MFAKVIASLFVIVPLTYIFASAISWIFHTTRVRKDTQKVLAVLRNNWFGEPEEQILDKTGLSADRFHKIVCSLLLAGARQEQNGKWVLRKAA